MTATSTRATRATVVRRQRRGDDTRRRIIEETALCIVEEGFDAASTSRILERAGVTWGVVQYHFGGREELLLAVVDGGMEMLADAFRDIAPQGSLDRSALRATLDAAWRAFSHPLSRASFEVLIATRSTRSRDTARHLRRMDTTLDDLGAQLFVSPWSPRDGRLVWAAMRGLALTAMVVPGEVVVTQELDDLTDLLWQRRTTYTMSGAFTRASSASWSVIASCD